MEIEQIRATVLFISAFLSFVLALTMWFKSKAGQPQYEVEDKITYHIGWVAFFSALFCFTYGGIFFFEQNKLFWSRATWLGVLMLPAYIISLYYAEFSYKRKVKYLKLKSFFWYFSAVVVVFFALQTPYFIKDVSPEYPYPDTSGFLKPLGRLYIIICLGISLFYLFRQYFESRGAKRWQLRLHVLGTAIYSIGGFVLAGILPLFYPKFSRYTDISALLSTLWVGLITYAIFKRRLFAIRVILTEILVAIIGVILLIKTVLSQSLAGRGLSFVIFFAFLLVGYLLIKVTQKEVQRKEEAERLAEELKELNETLEDRIKKRTKNLEESYQEIKKRKDELEEFYNQTVKRELKMIEMKKEIQELKNKLREHKIQ